MSLRDELLKVDVEKLKLVAQSVVGRNLTNSAGKDSGLNIDWRQRNPALVVLSEAIVDTIVGTIEDTDDGDDDDVVNDIENMTAGANLALFILSEYCEVVAVEQALSGLASGE